MKLQRIIALLMAAAIATLLTSLQAARAELRDTKQELQRTREKNRILTELQGEALSKIDALEGGMHEVMFTSYYTGDDCKSGAVTGSGKSTADFKVNEQGFYTYGGRVVLAAATWAGINAKTGACGKYNSVPRGYSVYSYGDIVKLELNGVEYEGIILDTCGASYWDEALQRIDIFVSSSAAAVGKVRGYISQ